MRTLRALTRSDLSARARLYVTSFNALPWNDHWTARAARERLKDVLDAPRFYGLVAHDGEKLLAAMLGNIERCYDRSHYNLKEMYVQPRCQRSGIGSAQMMSRKIRRLG